MSHRRRLLPAIDLRTSFAPLALLIGFAAGPPLAAADEPADQLANLLKQPLLQPGEATQQHVDYVLARIPKLQLAASADAWQAQAGDLRQRVLEEVVFRGIPDRWRAESPQIEWFDEIETGRGYRIRKLRYEALPGLWIPALLYQPDQLDGKTPVVLNVNGHDGDGKAARYKQLRCINLAKRGMLALNVEWLGMGQLHSPGYSHNHLAMLDLCGRSGLSVFFLAMSRGIDVLLDHPNADPDRLAVTGLSGGGWQTIILSSLDTRVKLSVPVAGYSAVAQRVEHRGSIGDLEQNPCDLISIADYSHLTALMVPRPTLLVYNETDNCCFPSPTVKPNTFDPVVPFFDQAGAADKFAWHSNIDPGTHNYELDNRRQLYRFLNRHFLAGEETIDDEIPSDDEVKSAEELNVPMPEDNATFLSLAAEAAAVLPQPLAGKTQQQQRELLSSLLRFEELKASATQTNEPAVVDELSVTTWRLQMGDQWTLPAAAACGASPTRTVVLLADDGYAAHAEQASQLARGGARVICLDVALVGQAAPGGTLYQNAQLIAAVGRRPLGVQVAQLLAAIDAFRERFKVDSIEIVSTGPRTGLAAACAAALDGGQRIARVDAAGLPESLKDFLQANASFGATPEVYCFGLLQHFDLPQLRMLAGTAR